MLSGISRAALSLTGRPKKRHFGPSPILSGEEGALLVSWIRDIASKGFPRKANDLKKSVQKFLSANPRSNKFKNNRPGEGVS
nr:unnamed protein product [Callosobruchus analis]